MSLFISFEGVEGSGKSTQIDMLRSFLIKQNITNFIITKEPGGTEVGNKIREILLFNKSHLNSYTEVFLYLASRVENTTNVITPALDAGKIVIADRYSDSTIAYQVSGRGLPEKLIRELNTHATGGIIPNITFLLDLDPKKGLQRVGIKKDRIENENIDFHLKVRGAYKTLARKNPERYVTIDAKQTPENIHLKIIKNLKHFLPEIKV